MSEKLMAMLQQEMVDTIVAHTDQAQEHIGKSRINERVMAALARVPRHQFVPIELTPFAYSDQPLPIGYEKTISQPFIVALMTDLLDPQPTDRVLEIGTGLGYHAAVLAELAGQVCTVEIIEELATQAKRRLESVGYIDVETRIGNGEHGWPEKGPFDRILVCAASELIPATLLMQLKPGGRMVVPTGLAESQSLTLVEKNEAGRIRTREVLPVRFALLETAN